MVSSHARPRNSLVLLNVVSNYARFAVAILCTVLLTPIVIHHLGSTSFGLWTLILCISGYLELFDLGLTAGAMRSIAALGDERTDEKNRLVSSLVAVSLALSPLVVLVGATVGLWLSNGPDADTANVPWLVALVSLRVILILPLGVLMGVLFGEHRIWMVNTLRAGSIAAFTLLASIAMHAGGGILSLGILYAVVYTLEYVAYGILAVRVIPWLRIDLRCFDRDSLRGVVGFSASSFTANASNVMLMRTDPLIVSSFLSLGAVALYAVPMRIAEQLFTLSKQLINVFSPLFAQLHGSGRIDSVRSAYITCTKFSFGMMVAIVIPAAFFASEALSFWIGSEFAASQGVLTILLAAAVLRTLQESSANALVMTGKHYFVARVSTASAVANLLLSLALVRPFGILGVAMATLISVAIFGCLITTYRACRVYEINVWRFIRRVVVPSIAPAIAQSLALWALQDLRQPNSLIDLALYGAASVLIFAIVYGLASLNPEERIVVKHWSSRVTAHLSCSLIKPSHEPGPVEVGAPISKESC